MISDLIEINDIPLEDLVVMAGLKPSSFLRMDNPLIQEIEGLNQNLPFIRRHLVRASIDALNAFEGRPGSIGILCMGAEALGHSIAAAKAYDDAWQNIDLFFLYLPRIVIGDASYHGAIHLDELEKYDRKGNNSPKEVFTYLDQTGILEYEQILFADTGFFGSIPNLIYQITERYRSEIVPRFRGFLIKTAFMMHGGIEIPIIESRSGKQNRTDKFDDYIRFFDRHWYRSRDQPSRLIREKGLFVPNTSIYEDHKLELYMFGRYIIENSVKEYFK